MLRSALVITAMMLPSFVHSQALAQDVISPVQITAQEAVQAPTITNVANNQTRCIQQMSEFPTDDPTARYQFFKLVTDVAYGADDQTDALFAHYGAEEVAEDTPVLATIEDIANPVLRQAAPAFIVSNMKYLVDFVQSCDVYIMGQTKSLVAYDPNLAKPEFNAVVTEDALFLRQILSESLQRLGAEDDPVWAGPAKAYSSSLVAQRNAVEFSSFETGIAELEGIFMEDLDVRLAKSNQTINAEIDRDVLKDAIALSNEMTETAEERSKQESLRRLIRIFTGGG